MHVIMYERTKSQSVLQWRSFHMFQTLRTMFYYYRNFCNSFFYVIQHKPVYANNCVIIFLSINIKKQTLYQHNNNARWPFFRGFSPPQSSPYQPFWGWFGPVMWPLGTHPHPTGLFVSVAFLLYVSTSVF